MRVVDSDAVEKCPRRVNVVRRLSPARSAGSRSYYHTDLLGSIRSVVQGATVTERYDYDPWGVLMPARSLGSGTKEKFTTKERDAESQLDYFGARSYASAIGRWTTVDPPVAADSTPQWNPCGYVKGNPVTYSDPFGLCPNPQAGGLGGLQCAIEDVIGAVKAAPGMVWDAIRPSTKRDLVFGLAQTPFLMVGAGEKAAVEAVVPLVEDAKVGILFVTCIKAPVGQSSSALAARRMRFALSELPERWSAAGSTPKRVESTCEHLRRGRVRIQMRALEISWWRGAFSMTFAVLWEGTIDDRDKDLHAARC